MIHGLVEDKAESCGTRVPQISDFESLHRHAEP